MSEMFRVLKANLSHGISRLRRTRSAQSQQPTFTESTNKNDNIVVVNRDERIPMIIGNMWRTGRPRYWLRRDKTQHL